MTVLLAVLVLGLVAVVLLLALGYRSARRDVAALERAPSPRPEEATADPAKKAPAAPRPEEATADPAKTAAKTPDLAEQRRQLGLKLMAAGKKFHQCHDTRCKHARSRAHDCHDLTCPVKKAAEAAPPPAKTDTAITASGGLTATLTALWKVLNKEAS